MASENIEDNFLFRTLNNEIIEYNRNHPEKGIGMGEAMKLSEELIMFLKKNDWMAVHSFFKKFSEEYEGTNTSREIEYALTRASIVLAQKDIDVIKENPGMLHGFIDVVSETKKQIIVMKQKITYSECKKLMTAVITSYYEDNYSNNKPLENLLIFPFLLSENIEIRGNIVLKRTVSPELINLLTITMSKDNYQPTIKFFGDKSNLTSAHTYAEYFYVYMFVSDTKMNYFLLSKEDLASQHYTITGMLVEITDNIKLGNVATTATAVSVIIATSATPDIKNITEKIFFDYVKGFDHEKLAKMFFGMLRHTKKFEKLLFAWLFCGKISGYPLHLLWIGPPGTAKSWTLNALAEHIYNESILDCSDATFKSIIPSYGGQQIEPGFLLKCNRIACIDEFFRAFKRGNSSEEESGLLTTLLEGSKRGYGSGKHTFIEAKMNARVLMTCNPQQRMGTILEMIQSGLDKAFLSRMLIYNQTKAHVEFVQTRRISLLGLPKEEVYPVRNPQVIQMTDFLNGFSVPNIPYDKINDVYAQCRELLPQDIAQQIYDSRYDHHLICLLDGITKYNVITEGRDNWNVTQKDIDDAEILFMMCILSWDDTISHNKISTENKIDLLPTPAVDLYNLISAEPNKTIYYYAKQLPHAHYWKNILIKWNLIKELKIKELNNDNDTKTYCIANQ